MSISIKVQEAQTVDLDELVIINIVDNFQDKIVARVQGIPLPVVLWSGADEYAAAGDWTNSTATDRLNEIVNSGNVPFDL
jgi:hypothetical protein